MYKKKITIFIDHQLKGQRADVVVSKQVPFLSRSSTLKSFQKQVILVNDLICKPSYRCKEGDILILYLPKDQNNPTQIKPSSRGLNIIFEDHWVLVVNKPSSSCCSSRSGASSRHSCKCLDGAYKRPIFS